MAETVPTEVPIGRVEVDGFRPAAIRPMLAVPGRLPVDETGWATEVKWDGVRALAWCDRGRVTLTGRNGADLTGTFPEIAGLAGPTGEPLLIDGELVVSDPDGRPDFSLIQRRLGRATTPASARRAIYMIFDLIYAGHDLRELPWRERRARLDGLALEGEAWRVPPADMAGPADLFEATGAEGLEGVVLKRIDSPYRSGRRHPDWIKVKHRRRQEFVIGGWLPGQGGRSGKIGALLAGYCENGKLIYAGRVGSGFSERGLEEASRLLEPLATPESPFEPVPGLPAARYVRPVMVAEVEFHQWTGDGLLRHPVFKGWRHDKLPRQVTRE